MILNRAETLVFAKGNYSLVNERKMMNGRKNEIIIKGKNGYNTVRNHVGSVHVHVKYCIMVWFM